MPRQPNGVSRVVDAYRKPKHPRSKYDPEIVRKIRKEWKERTTYKSLAKDYGFTPRQIDYIVNLMEKRSKASQKISHIQSIDEARANGRHLEA